MQHLNLKAYNPVYKAWKRAVNSSVSHLLTTEQLNGAESVYQYLEETYGCKTLYVQKHTVDRTVRHVDLEFLSKEHYTHFMLVWS